MLPALHAFGHFYSGTETGLNYQETENNLTGSVMACDLCDFNFSSSDEPQLFTVDFYTPQKNIVYTISLKETTNSLPLPYFSLRAPPVIIA